jgi:hypothetical protein
LRSFGGWYPSRWQTVKLEIRKMNDTSQLQTQVPANTEWLKLLLASLDGSIPDHTVTISVDRGYFTGEDLDSAITEASNSIKANGGDGRRKDTDNGFIMTAYFRGDRDAGEIKESLHG